MNTETISTVSYMAPESLAKSTYSEHSDVYAFGICAFEVLQEEPPFGDLEGFKLINSVVNEGIRPTFKRHNPKLAKVIDMIESCWEPMPQHRPSMDDICKQLVETLKNYN